MRNDGGAHSVPHTLYGALQILMETRIEGILPTTGPASGGSVTVNGMAFSTKPHDYACIFAAPNASGVPGMPEQVITVPAVLSTQVLCAL